MHWLALVVALVKLILRWLYDVMGTAINSLDQFYEILKELLRERIILLFFCRRQMLNRMIKKAEFRPMISNSAVHITETRTGTPRSK
jgi:hypothetical protein